MLLCSCNLIVLDVTVWVTSFFGAVIPSLGGRQFIIQLTTFFKNYCAELDDEKSVDDNSGVEQEYRNCVAEATAHDDVSDLVAVGEGAQIVLNVAYGLIWKDVKTM